MERINKTMARGNRERFHRREKMCTLWDALQWKGERELQCQGGREKASMLGERKRTSTLGKEKELQC